MADHGKDNIKEDGIDIEAFEDMTASLSQDGLSHNRRESMHVRALARINAKAPANTSTIRAHDGEWVTVMPLVEMKVLREDPDEGNHTVLYRMHPGAVFPQHSHTQIEECLVLEGEINFGDFYVRAGDMHIAEPGSEHNIVESKTGALLLIRSEISEHVEA